jgi:hypothetical protein
VARGHTTAKAACRLQPAMPAGAICVFPGTLLNGRGADRAGAPRLAFTNQYCGPGPGRRRISSWVCPRDKVRGMSRKMQILLGYELLPTATSWAKWAATIRLRRSTPTSCCRSCADAICEGCSVADHDLRNIEDHAG